MRVWVSVPRNEAAIFDMSFESHSCLYFCVVASLYPWSSYSSCVCDFWTNFMFSHKQLRRFFTNRDMNIFWHRFDWCTNRLRLSERSYEQVLKAFELWKPELHVFNFKIFAVESWKLRFPQANQANSITSSRFRYRLSSIWYSYCTHTSNPPLISNKAK